MAPKQEKDYVCIREQQLSKNEQDITELKTRAKFKDQRIDELNQNVRDMDKKLDEIKGEIQKLQLQSIQDDSNIDNRVTALENTVKVLKWASVTSISFLGIVIAFLSFAIMHLH